MAHSNKVLPKLPSSSKVSQDTDNHHHLDSTINGKLKPTIKLKPSAVEKDIDEQVTKPISSSLVYLSIGVILAIIIAWWPSFYQQQLAPANLPVCYRANQSTKPYRLYGKSTVYNDAKGYFKQNYGDDGDRQPDEDECKPLMFYFIGRHSIRYPSHKKIVLMSTVLPRIQEEIVQSSQNNGHGQLCADDLEAIKSWKLRIGLEDDNRISESGFNQTQQLAMELFQRFPDLLSASKADINVGITYETRTKETAQAFIDGLLKVQPNFHVDIKDQDFVYFHRTCKKILGDRLKISGLEEKLNQSDLAKKLIASVSRRAGLDRKLTIDEIYLIHVACAFEYAIHGESPWCYLFSQQDLQTLEFFTDVDEYFTDGHGLKLNHNMACPLVRDLISTIKQVSSSTSSGNKVKTSLYFTHAGAVQRLWTYLGLFDKIDLDYSFPPSPHRLWRTSLIVPFNANFITILYKCNNDDNNHKLLTMIQGHPVKVRGCRESLCSLEQFFAEYDNPSFNCDLNQMCKSKETD